MIARTACPRSSPSSSTTAGATPRAASGAWSTTPCRARTPSSSRPRFCRGSRSDYHVTFTKDPDGRATMGGSSGGACAFTMAWFHPELYRRVLTYSGTYVNQQSPLNPESPHGAWEYHEHLIPKSDREAAADLAGGGRERQRLPRRRSDAAQLGDGQPADGGGAEGEGLPLPVRFARRGPDTSTAVVARRCRRPWSGSGADTRSASAQ